MTASHARTSAHGPTAAIPADSDVVWSLGFSEAERMGCSYPGEPPGVYVRLLLEASATVTEEAARALIAQTVAQCDACYGHCTVPTKKS